MLVLQLKIPDFSAGALRAPDVVKNGGAEAEAEVWEVWELG